MTSSIGHADVLADLAVLALPCGPTRRPPQRQHARDTLHVVVNTCRRSGRRTGLSWISRQSSTRRPWPDGQVPRCWFSGWRVCVCVCVCQCVRTNFDVCEQTSTWLRVCVCVCVFVCECVCLVVFARGLFGRRPRGSARRSM